jgi:2-amino-4-hydroxy-6-hydroxymethyldihydropteridine diphosphokinase
MANGEKVFIALGGNVGDVAENFHIAVTKIKEMIGAIIKQSSLYKTEPWGNKNQDDFLNQVICVETNLSPGQVLKNILAIEKSMGRNRNKNNQFAPRNIDIDILFYDGKVINSDDLIIPHPRLHLRNFVLTPLVEIAPHLIHPVLNKTVDDLVKISGDVSVVSKA